MPISRPLAALRAQLAFLAASAVALLILLTLLRLALLGFNHALVGDTPAASLLAAFGNGLRFDLRLTVYLCLPLLLALACPPLARRRGWQRGWLGAGASVVIFLGIIELNFYQEFQQRLNALVFQYLQEDPATVLSMLWHGFPVLRLLAVWVALTAVFWVALAWLERKTRAAEISDAGEYSDTPPASVLRQSRWQTAAPMLLAHTLAFVVCAALAVLAARGTLRQGPPLRWGDAFTTESLFANQLGLNGALSLYTAAKTRYFGHAQPYKASLPEEEARASVRAMLLAPHEQLVDAQAAAVRRDTTPPADGQLPVRHVVVILMESLAGHYVSALGGPIGGPTGEAAITPNFDRLAKEGLLFTRFFSNGTHTHQGLFASMACFPNLPGFEYLMQMPEGAQSFSGLPQLLGARGYESLYVYNGDFAWDNQQGFFRNQGMTRFIGRNDYANPVFSDPTWGVSDQDMFDRAAQELLQFDGNQPFYALLQTLSNHTPYALPSPLPTTPVTGHGNLDEHLTAMRYADWALGRFFDQIRGAPWYHDTLFVILGDHAFSVPAQLTDINLLRFHIPMLLIAPGIRERFGATRDVVGSQVDMVPTIIGRLAGLAPPIRQQCWGRDLLSLPADDPGFAIVKPSGNDQTTAIVRGDQILVQPQGLAARRYHYQLGSAARASVFADAATDAPTDELAQQLAAYLQTATQSLLGHTTGGR